ncbi:MAG: hypothetical protein GYA55_10900 [SAR324 cluster bacterium]|uniref:Uncharacterized protein n=1 Tax=SAR324 cluster bacterium TaxID=2024889 RepID=A0A7X9IK16_9DELT|nr:hypothetical protein [SAR324 cluster bacterium]
MKIIISVLMLLSVFISEKMAIAEGSSAKDKQAGSVDITMDEKTKDPYKESQIKALGYLKLLKQKIEALGNGTSISQIEKPSNDVLHYLTGIYLHCTILKGVCPEILDSLLEVDLINSRLAKKAECPSLLGFWKHWKANDMEARQNHLVRIGFLAISSEFTRNTRPKYIKCQESIESMLDANMPDADYFKKRYEGESQSENAVSQSIKYVETASQTIPNIFTALNNMRK